MEAYDIFAELVVFVLQGAVALLDGLEFGDLLFEFFDVAFFALAEGTLGGAC